jgi:hypothetical protein
VGIPLYLAKVNVLLKRVNFVLVQNLHLIGQSEPRTHIASHQFAVDPQCLMAGFSRYGLFGAMALRGSPKVTDEAG